MIDDDWRLIICLSAVRTAIIVLILFATVSTSPIYMYTFAWCVKIHERSSRWEKVDDGRRQQREKLTFVESIFFPFSFCYYIDTGRCFAAFFSDWYFSSVDIVVPQNSSSTSSAFLFNDVRVNSICRRHFIATRVAIFRCNLRSDHFRITCAQVKKQKNCLSSVGPIIMWNEQRISLIFPQQQ